MKNLRRASQSAPSEAQPRDVLSRNFKLNEQPAEILGTRSNLANMGKELVHETEAHEHIIQQMNPPVNEDVKK